jgi:hypothetical protein
MTTGCSPSYSEPASGKSDLLFENLRLGKIALAPVHAGLLRSQVLESVGGKRLHLLGSRQSHLLRRLRRVGVQRLGT